MICRGFYFVPAENSAHIDCHIFALMYLTKKHFHVIDAIKHLINSHENTCQFFVTSLIKIAEIFGKQHKHVMQSIREVITLAEKLTDVAF